MNDSVITWTWKVSTPLHNGSGFSRAVFVDSCVQLSNRRAVLRKEAVKGAIRGTAEQLARWRGCTEIEADDASVPCIPVLKRIFAPDEKQRFYRFCGCVSTQEVIPYTVSSTKINPENRVAEKNTLRTIELVPEGTQFHGKIQLLAGRWDDTHSTDHKDLLFLLTALVSTEGIGGKKGTGFGRLECSEFKVNGTFYRDILATKETICILDELAKEK